MFSRAKPFAQIFAALLIAFGIFIGAVTTSRADGDYHWLDTFSIYSNSPGSAVDAFAFSPSGKLYIGGSFIDAGGVIVNGTAMWDGSEWHALGGGFGVNYGVNPGVSKIIAVSDTEVYYAGFFATLTNAPENNCAEETVYLYNIALWDGTCWHGLGPDANHLGVRVPTYSDVGDMEFFDGKLFVTGLFEFAGDVQAHGIAVWNGSTWQALDGEPNYGMSGNGYGTALATDGTTLYIGGSFDAIGGVPAANVAAYHDGAFFAVGSGLPGLNVIALLYANNVLYAGGNARDSVSPSLWEYTTENDWNVLGGGVAAGGGSGQVSALAYQNNQLYVAGYFGSAGQITALNLAIWDTQAQSWSEFGNPIGYPSGGVSDILFHNSMVYLAGGFTQVGGKQSLHLAIYDPNATPPPPETNLNLALDLSDNPVNSGDALSFCVSVDNYGPDAVTGVTLTSSVPNGATFDAISFDGCYGGGGGSTFNAKRVNGLAFPMLSPDCQTPNVGEAGAIQCALDDMQAYDSVQIRVDVTISAAPGSQIQFDASVSGNEPDTNENNNADTETLNVRPNVIYTSPNADCGANSPCVDNLNDAVSNVADGGTVNVLAGTYNESLYYSKDVTVNLSGDVNIRYDLYIGAGTFHSTSGVLSVGGSFTLDNATFNHNSGTVRFNGSYTQYVGGAFTFNHFAVSNGATVRLQNVMNIVGMLNNQGTLFYPNDSRDVSANTPTVFVDGFNQPAVQMDASGDLGTTTVAVMPGQTPDCYGTPLPANVTPLLRQFEITPSNEGIATTVRFYYDNSELNNVDEQTIGIYHCGYNAETGQYEWTLLTNSTPHGAENYAEVSGVDDFSPFALGGEQAAPTSVTLVSVNARVDKKGGVRMKWETGSELDVMGFNVYRSVQRNGEYKPVNKKLKNAKTPGEMTGNKYALRDKQAAAGKTYFYKIQVVKANGKFEWSEPIKIRVP